MSQSKTSASTDVPTGMALIEGMLDTFPGTPEMTPEELAAWAASPEGLAAQDELDSAAGKPDGGTTPAPDGETTTEPGTLDGEKIVEERDRWYTVVEYSEPFSKALEEFAKVNGTSKANIGRKALAQYIGFELEPEWANKTSGGGVKKYASKDEAKAALKVQAKVRQERTKLAMAVVKLELTGKAGTPAHTAAKDALEAFVKAHPFA